ncbi:MAG: CAP domain-containing protein [Lewinellaceae bacterium]|nr:CAP domain-containing protein [Lewinellaceae bacterium]
MKILFLLLSGTVVLTWCAEKTAIPASAPTLDKITAKAVLDEVNALRATGCKCPGGKRFDAAPALQWEETLEKVAQHHADDMNKRRYFNHTSPDGTGFSKRIRNAGYDWRQVGENIAMGYPTAKAVVEAWRTSKDHCPNLMNPGFRDMGVGKAGAYWVQDLGAK